MDPPEEPPQPICATVAPLRPTDLPALGELLARWGRHLRKHRAPLTVGNYEFAIRAVLADVARLLGRAPELSDLTRAHLQAAIEEAPPGSVKVRLTAVRQLYHYLVDLEELPIRDVSRGLLCPRLPEPEPPRLLSEKEARAIVLAPLQEGSSARHVRDALTLLLLYGQGLRRVEVHRLDVESVLLDAGGRGQVALRVQGKRGRWATIPCGQRVRAGIRAYLAVRTELVTDPSEPALLLSGRSAGQKAGGRLSRKSIYDTVRRYVPEEVECYPHLFRHAFASHLLDAGAPLHATRDLMRHTSLATTSIYSRSSGKILRRALSLHPLDRADEDDEEED